MANDRAKWRTEVANYAKVRYRGIYRGVDLVFYGNQEKLEYDLIVKPGADPNVIRLAFDGARSMSVDRNGDLVLQTPGEVDVVVAVDGKVANTVKVSIK